MLTEHVSHGEARRLGAAHRLDERVHVVRVVPVVLPERALVEARGLELRVVGALPRPVGGARGEEADLRAVGRGPRARLGELLDRPRRLLAQRLGLVGQPELVRDHGQAVLVVAALHGRAGVARHVAAPELVRAVLPHEALQRRVRLVEAVEPVEALGDRVRDHDRRPLPAHRRDGVHEAAEPAAGPRRLGVREQVDQRLHHVPVQRRVDVRDDGELAEVVPRGPRVVVREALRGVHRAVDAAIRARGARRVHRHGEHAVEVRVEELLELARRVRRRRRVDRDPPERRVPLRARAVADRVERQVAELDLLIDPRLLDAHRRQCDLKPDLLGVGRVEREDRAGVDAVLGRRVDEPVVVAPRLHGRRLQRARGVVQRVGRVVEVPRDLSVQLHGAVRARLDLHRRRPAARVVRLEVHDEARRRARGERVAVHARARGRRDLGLDRARRAGDRAVLPRDVAEPDGVEAGARVLVVVRERVRVRARAGARRVRPGRRDHEEVTAAAGAPDPVEVGVREARDLRLRVVVPGVVAARGRAWVDLREAVRRLRGRHVVAVVTLGADEDVDQGRVVGRRRLGGGARGGRGREADDGERHGERARDQPRGGPARAVRGRGPGGRRSGVQGSGGRQAGGHGVLGQGPPAGAPGRQGRSGGGMARGAGAGPRHPVRGR